MLEIEEIAKRKRKRREKKQSDIKANRMRNEADQFKMGLKCTPNYTNGVLINI